MNTYNLDIHEGISLDVYIYIFIYSGPAIAYTLYGEYTEI